MLDQRSQILSILSSMPAPTLKFQDQIASLESCPPRDCTEETTTVFRFVRAEINDAWNFTPQALKNPSRKFKDDEEQCSGFALSVFQSLLEARAFYAKMRKKRLKVELILGTHIGSLNIEPDDGRLTPAREDGHRDFHVYDGATYLKRATVVEPLSSVVMPMRQLEL